MQDPKIDVIIITTPNNTHFSTAKKALLANKHVVVEKPFVISSNEGSELNELANKQHKILTVYHNRRWDSGFLTLKKLLAQKTLGNLTQVEIHFDRFRPEVNPAKWRETMGRGNGILYDLGSHLVDQALNLFGSPKNYFADVGIQRPGGEAPDYFHIIFQYDPLRVILHASSVVPRPLAHFVVHGDGGSFVKWSLDPQEAQLRAGMLPNHPDFGKDETLAELTLPGQSAEAYPLERGDYAEFYRQLYRAIVDRRFEPPVLAKEALEVIEWIEKLS
jgi:scyllo-inositol 2-dehydrogenase (NADP+)